MPREMCSRVAAAGILSTPSTVHTWPSKSSSGISCRQASGGQDLPADPAYQSKRGTPLHKMRRESTPLLSVRVPLWMAGLGICLAAVIDRSTIRARELEAHTGAKLRIVELERENRRLSMSAGA